MTGILRHRRSPTSCVPTAVTRATRGSALVVSLAMGCPFHPNEKQALLEAKTLADQARCLTALMELAGGGEDDDAPLQ